MARISSAQHLLGHLADVLTDVARDPLRTMLRGAIVGVSHDETVDDDVVIVKLPNGDKYAIRAKRIG